MSKVATNPKKRPLSELDSTCDLQPSAKKVKTVTTGEKEKRKRRKSRSSSS
jgi:hypothetical protein